MISCLLVCMLFNRISIDIGFRVIPIYMILPLLVFLILGIRKNYIRKLTNTEVFAFSFYFYAIFTSIYSSHIDGSFRFVLGVILTGFTYLIVRYFILRSVIHFDNSVWWAGLFFVVGGIVNYLIGLANMNLLAEHVDFWGVTIEKAIPRMIGFNNDPNICAFANLIFFFYFFSKPHLINKVISGLCFLTIIATMSRGGLFALILGIFSIFALKKGKSFFKYLVFLVFFLLLITLVYNLNYDSFQPFIEKRLSGLNTGGGRFNIWLNSFVAFQERPFFGYGIFTFKEVMSEAFNDPRHAHNTYIEVLLETGVFGLIFYISFLSFLLCNSYRLAIKYDVCKFLLPSNISIFVAMSGLSMYINPIFWFLLLLNTSFYYYVMSKRFSSNSIR